MTAEWRESRFPTQYVGRRYDRAVWTHGIHWRGPCPAVATSRRSRSTAINSFPATRRRPGAIVRAISSFMRSPGSLLPTGSPSVFASCSPAARPLRTWRSPSRGWRPARTAASFASGTKSPSARWASRWTAARRRKPPARSGSLTSKAARSAAGMATSRRWSTGKTMGARCARSVRKTAGGRDRARKTSSFTSSRASPGQI